MKAMQALHWLGKWKYVILLALAGVVILLLPTKNQEVAAVEEPEIVEVSVPMDDEKKMEEILSQVEGAGRVRVMLTTKNSGITEYQTDTESSKTEGGSEDQRVQTVFGTSQEALVRSVTAPEYLGALVLCQGAESAQVRLSVIKAVCALTGLGSDKVTVLKMKD